MKFYVNRLIFPFETLPLSNQVEEDSEDVEQVPEDTKIE
jgi:hypothetical protein